MACTYNYITFVRGYICHLVIERFIHVRVSILGVWRLAGACIEQSLLTRLEQATCRSYRYIFKLRGISYHLPLF